MAITMDGVELGVAITEKAAEKIKYFAEKEGVKDNVGLRVAVKGGGCSGLTYDLKITGEELETDKVVEAVRRQGDGGQEELHLPSGHRTGLLRRPQRQGFRL